jgi:hypothetical protein
VFVTLPIFVLHKDKFDLLRGGSENMKLMKQNCLLQITQNILSATTKTNEVAVQASFNISQITAKK